MKGVTQSYEKCDYQQRSEGFPKLKNMIKRIIVTSENHENVMCRQTNKPAACCACSAAAAGSEPLGCEGACVFACARDRLLGGWLCSAPSSGAPPRSCRRPAASAGSRSPPSERPESDHTLLREERGKKGGIRKGEGGKGGGEGK